MKTMLWFEWPRPFPFLKAAILAAVFVASFAVSRNIIRYFEKHWCPACRRLSAKYEHWRAEVPAHPGSCLCTTEKSCACGYYKLVRGPYTKRFSRWHLRWHPDGRRGVHQY